MVIGFLRLKIMRYDLFSSLYYIVLSHFSVANSPEKNIIELRYLWMSIWYKRNLAIQSIFYMFLVTTTFH